MDRFVEGHLDLQVRISYPQHSNFLLRHGLAECRRVLDLGTGNGTFAARLAQDHPRIHFVGIDKRAPCVESAKGRTTGNFDVSQVDVFSRHSAFDFSAFDGVLMRYFLLHVDHARKILELFQQKSKRPSRFWIIDLDWSQFTCHPPHPSVEKMTGLVRDFCAKVSPDSRGGQNVLPLLRELEYENVVVEHLPFTHPAIPLEDLALYLKQEAQCYSRMMGRGPGDTDTAEIVQFFDREFQSGAFAVSYGMVLISAELKIN